MFSISSIGLFFTAINTGLEVCSLDAVGPVGPYAIGIDGGPIYHVGESRMREADATEWSWMSIERLGQFDKQLKALCKNSDPIEFKLVLKLVEDWSSFEPDPSGKLLYRCNRRGSNMPSMLDLEGNWIKPQCEFEDLLARHSAEPDERLIDISFVPPATIENKDTAKALHAVLDSLCRIVELGSSPARDRRFFETADHYLELRPGAGTYRSSAPRKPEIELSRGLGRLWNAIWKYADWRKSRSPVSEVVQESWGDEEKRSTALPSALTRLNKDLVDHGFCVSMAGDWLIIELEKESD